MTEIDWFAIVSGVLGGVALLMYGIRTMGEGLEHAAGDAMRTILTALTRNAWLAALVGTVVTAIVQSSSAVTVMTVGFVNAQLMTFRQALGVIYGANVGTTITGQIMAFEITNAALPAIAIGFGLQYFTRNRKIQNLGQGILGFGMLFLGLLLLKDSVESLRNSDMAVQAFTHFNDNLLFAVLAGAAITVCIQSSSASLGIAMALAAHDLITLPAAIALMLGDNIGTCITAQVTSIGTQPTAKRTAWAHTLHNVVGVGLVLLLLRWFIPLVAALSPGTQGLEPESGAYQAAIQRQIANSHTIFNVLNALLFLSINKWFALLLETWIPDRRRGGHEIVHIDRRLLDRPTAAAGATLQELARMARKCRHLVQESTQAVLRPREVDTRPLWSADDEIDDLQDSITEYLVELMEQDMPDFIFAQVPAMLHVANDLERVGDHCKNLLELSEERRDNDLPWSETAEEEIKTMAELVDAMLFAAAESLSGANGDLPNSILEMEKRVDQITADARKAHLDRAGEGECLMLAGVLFLDALMNYEKMGDHVRNVARALNGGLLDAGARLLPSDDEEDITPVGPTGIVA